MEEGKQTNVLQHYTKFDVITRRIEPIGIEIRKMDQ